jgi:erythromycin esterase
MSGGWTVTVRQTGQRQGRARQQRSASMATVRCMQPIGWTHYAVISTVLALAGASAVDAQQPPAPSSSDVADSSVVHWARTHAIRLRGVDAPYDEASFAFLRPLVGTARVLAVGELIHGGHQPLAFRNEVIRYAVTHLGVTAVALESGFTEAATVDRYIQGGAGNIDSVVKTGLTWEFETLPENRELILQLRAHNAHAVRKVHFYGLDLSGTDDDGFMPGARVTVLAALDYLKEADPNAGMALNARLLPLMDRFAPARYGTYSAADRDHLKTALDSVYQALLDDSTRARRASPPLAYARGLRNAWMAVRMNEIMALDAADSAGPGHTTILFRDSTMAENTRWVVGQLAPGDRLLVFAHDYHVMDTDPVYDGRHLIPLGHYLRSTFDSNLVVLATAAGTIIGGTGGIGGWIGDSGVARAAPNTFAGALAQVGLPTFAIDVHKGDRSPAVTEALMRSWLFLPSDTVRAIVPRRAFDAIVYLDRVTPSKVVH